MEIRSTGDAAYTQGDAKTVSGSGFDWTMLALSLWLVAGASVDAWAHSHFPSLETFFTPWHGVLYSGFLAVSTGLAIATWKNHAVQKNWLKAVPRGYEWSALGAIIFALGGVGDMFWHILFGIEANIDALLSPTHLSLSAGAVLITSGPLRAAWYRKEVGYRPGWSKVGPAIISLGFVFALFSYMTTFSHPFVRFWPLASTNPSITANPYGMTVGVSGIIIQAAILIGVVLFSLRRWHLPFGAYTVIFLMNSLVISAFSRDVMIGIPVAIVAGLITDVLNAQLQPSEKQPVALRLFAFLVPSIFYFCYFLALSVLGLVMNRAFLWSIHLWMGTAVICGIAGLLLSFVMVPMARPEIEE